MYTELVSYNLDRLQVPFSVILPAASVARARIIFVVILVSCEDCPQSRVVEKLQTLLLSLVYYQRLRGWVQAWHLNIEAECCTRQMTKLLGWCKKGSLRWSSQTQQRGCGIAVNCEYYLQKTGLPAGSRGDKRASGPEQEWHFRSYFIGVERVPCLYTTLKVDGKCGCQLLINNAGNRLHQQLYWWARKRPPSIKFCVVWRWYGTFGRWKLAALQ